jgi:hypothetical protein
MEAPDVEEPSVEAVEPQVAEIAEAASETETAVEPVVEEKPEDKTEEVVEP